MAATFKKPRHFVDDYVKAVTTLVGQSELEKWRSDLNAKFDYPLPIGPDSAEDHVKELLYAFCDKLSWVPIRLEGMELECKPASQCSVDIDGTHYEIDISGHIGITGRAFGENGTEKVIFHRYIGRTFWQYVGKEK